MKNSASIETSTTNSNKSKANSRGDATPESGQSNSDKKKHSILISSKVLKILKDTQDYCSLQDFKTKPTLSQIAELLIFEPKEVDLKRVYESTLSSKDKLNIELKKYNIAKGKDLSLHEFMCEKLKIN